MERPELAGVEQYGLVLSLPEAIPNASLPECMTPQILTYRECPEAAGRREVFSIIEQVNQSIRVHPDMQSGVFLDPFKVFCDEDVCRQIEDGMWVYTDSSHLSPYGSKKLVRAYKEEIESLVNSPAAR